MNPAMPPATDRLTLILQLFVIYGPVILTMLGIAYKVIQAMKEGRKKNALLILTSLGELAVREGMHEANDLKNKDKPGVWDEEAKARLKARGTSFIKKLGEKELTLVLGTAAKVATVNEFVSKVIEANVQLAKSPNSVDGPPPVVQVEPVPDTDPLVAKS